MPRSFVTFISRALRSDVAIFSLAVAAALALIFAPYVFGGYSLLSGSSDAPSIYATGATPTIGSPHVHTLDPGAPAWTTEPWAAIQHSIMYGERRMPFWDPYTGYGEPFDAAMQPQPFYPLTALYAIHPSPRAYTWFVLARLFFAGLFAALFMRLFADRYASAVAGIGTALTGYYLLYYNMPHLSVDAGFPMLLWATELAVRRRTAQASAALGIATGLIYLGGMPETALLSISIGVAYGGVRIATSSRARIERLFALAGGNVSGLFVGAITTVPFLELLPRSFDTHRANQAGAILVGLQSDSFWTRGLLTELAPLSFGYPLQSVFSDGTSYSGIRGFFGCTLLVLALIAILSQLRRRNASFPIVAFFAILATACLLKRFGNPALDWIGTLPGFDLVQFPKYLEFVLGTSIALLAGFGLAALRKGAASSLVIGGAFAGTLSAITGLDLATWAAVPDGPRAWHHGAAIVTGVLALVIAIGLGGLVARSQTASRRNLSSILLAGLVVAEITAGFAGPQLWRAMAPLSADPYGGAPYLKYLDDHVDRNRERVFGLDNTLYPNWPGAYGFSDPRALNAIYPIDYLPFIDAFLAPRVSTNEDLHDRFTGSRPIWLDSSRVRQWMNLSSISWIVSQHAIPAPKRADNAFLDAMWQQLEPTLDEAQATQIRPLLATVGRVPKDALSEPAPFDAATYRSTVPLYAPRVVADVALLAPPNDAQATCAGPVTFLLSAERNGAIIATSRSIVDANQQRWTPLVLDLLPQAGHEVTLRFSTATSGSCSLLPVWGEPRFAGVAADQGDISKAGVLQPAFQEAGVYVYHNLDAQPRIRLVHRARVVVNSKEALDEVSSPLFDARSEAIVASPIAPLQPPRGSDQITVVRSRSDEVVVSVASPAGGLLVQNDTDYPGWRATVDGNERQIVRANYLFRGIVIPPGEHLVAIRYESIAARVGTIGTAVGLLSVLALLVWPPLLRRSRFRRRSALA